ncbi:MAG: Flagellar hook-basal body complex protein FliE [bacterium]|nr:Flagellar hook-basal body complex protein FliE [bacterium]
MIDPLIGPAAAASAQTTQVGGPGPTGALTKSFGDILSGYMSQLTSAQADSRALTQEFLAGGPVDISQVAIALEESSLAMNLLIEVRNKVLEAYETLLRMPV